MFVFFSFLPHLKEILDNDSPAWDKNKEYKSDQVSVHYVDGVKGGWVEVDPNAKLVDIMRQERYVYTSVLQSTLTNKEIFIILRQILDIIYQLMECLVFSSFQNQNFVDFSLNGWELQSRNKSN